MIPNSLLNYISREATEWPAWLPFLVQTQNGDIRELNHRSDVVFVSADCIFTDVDPEVESLFGMILDKGFEVVRMWDKLPADKISPEIEKNLH